MKRSVVCGFAVMVLMFWAVATRSPGPGPHTGVQTFANVVMQVFYYPVELVFRILGLEGEAGIGAVFFVFPVYTIVVGFIAGAVIPWPFRIAADVFRKRQQVRMREKEIKGVAMYRKFRY